MRRAAAVLALALGWTFVGVAEEEPEEAQGLPLLIRPEAQAFCEAWKAEVEGADPLKAAEAYAKAESLCKKPCWFLASSRVRRASSLARAGKREEAKALLKDLEACPPEFEPLRQALLSDAEQKPPEAALLAALLTRLGDSAYAVREEATRELKALGPRILPELRTALARAEDLEVRTRLEGLVEALDAPEFWLGFLLWGQQPCPFVLLLRRGEDGAFTGTLVEPVLQPESEQETPFQPQKGVEVVVSKVTGKLEKDGAFTFQRVHPLFDIVSAGEGRLQGDTGKGSWDEAEEGAYFLLRHEPLGKGR